MKDYKVCQRCVMDTSAEDITFDSEGICNYCTEYLESLNHVIPSLSIVQFFEKIKKDGVNKEYDTIIGVSGGVDSSFVLHLAKEHSLRPLVIHLDNGWNSELAVHNIHSIIEACGFPLYTHVIDWPENKDMQLSFMKADVVDIELLMDNAMRKLNYSLANKYGIKYILSGSNTANEGFRMPPNWNHYKKDKKNIVAIHKKHGSVPIKTHPLLSIYDQFYYEYLKKIQWCKPLDYINYKKNDALEILIREYGYKPYAHKHYESVFTRFYQGYILPRKFGYDKRKLHLSNLILNNEISREKALSTLENDPYPDQELLKSDINFVTKKLGITEEELNEYIKRPPRSHYAYPNHSGLINKIKSS